MEMKLKAITRIMLTLFLICTMTTASDIAHTANGLSVHNIDTGRRYETIQDAINAIETLEGHTIRVDAEIYSEHVTVNKSLTLLGEDRSTTIIDGSETGTVIDVTANNVQISGFTLRNSGPNFDDKGIRLDHSSSAIINENVIANITWGIWLDYATHSIISENIMQDSTFGGVYLGNSANNSIRCNIIQNNSRYGMWLERSDNNIIHENIVIENEIGISLAVDSNDNVISGNAIKDNDEGIHLFSSFNNIYENTITNNLYGIFSLHSGGNVIYRNNFMNNVIRQASLNESYVDVWDNGCEGNYWSDYEGQDLNGDGVGDTFLPHQGLDQYPLMEEWSRIRTFNVTWGEDKYEVSTFSNSTIASFSFNSSLKQISFNVTGPPGAVGFCNVTIPKSLLRDSWLILIDETNVTAGTVIVENSTHTFFYVSYSFSTHTVKIIGTKISDRSPPVANAGPDQTVDEDDPVTFDGTGSYDNIGITSYTWTFTDETQQTLKGVSPTYTFANPGTYTITLNVSDGARHYATDTVMISILDVTKPLANAGSNKTVMVNTEVSFNASGSSDNVGIVSYEWDFNDGSPVVTEADPITIHTYTQPGTYRVTLIAEDSAGNIAPDSITVTVRKPEIPIYILWVIGGTVGVVILVYIVSRKRRSIARPSANSFSAIEKLRSKANIVAEA